MKFRKDDPIFYKEKLKELLQQAKDNNIQVVYERGTLSFTAYANLGEYEEVLKLEKMPICRTSVSLKEYRKKGKLFDNIKGFN